MRLKFEMADRQRWAARHEQVGFTLVEVLVSIVLIGLVAGALTAGVITALRTSANANDSARASVLLTSFEETLLQLKYLPCSANGSSLAGNYEDSFRTYEENLEDSGDGPRRIKVADHIDAKVVKVESACSAGASADDGEQELFVEVTYNGRTRTGNVVKRDPNPPGRLLKAAFKVTVLTGDGAPHGPYDPSDPGDPPESKGDLKGVFQLDASPSYSPNPILEYSWDCNTDDDTDSPIVTPGDEPLGECVYNAEADPKGYKDYLVTLTIRDSTGATATSDPATLRVEAAAQPIAKPQARIVSASCPTVGCTGGDAALTVVFKGEGAVAGNRTIDKYEWNFGDGSTSNDPNPTHEYNPPSPHVYYPVLRVRDSDGIWSHSPGAGAPLPHPNGTPNGQPAHSLRITIVGPARPTAAFTMLPGNTVAAPQNVKFDANASVDHNGVHENLQYIWDLGGHGVTTLDPITSLNFNSKGEQSITLTVKDLNNGATHFIKQVLNVTEVSIGDGNEDIGFKFLYATNSYRTGDFYFQWKNPQASPGDRFEYDIQVKSPGGICRLFGTHQRTAYSNQLGSPQIYDFHVDAGYALGFVPLPGWVCSGQLYTYRVLAIRRIDVNGTIVDTYGPLDPVTVRI